MSGDIRIGTCGWNYPAGAGTWNGVFYPAPAARPRRFDELAYYAEHFDTVEVNSTFYRPPAAATATRWAARTPAGFDFSLKLHQRFTHPRMAGRGGSVAPGADAAPESPIPVFTDADVGEFRRGMDPLARAGKLGALLAQFPPSFHDTPEAREYLVCLLRRFGDYPLAVELRHRSWSDAQGETLRLLGGFGAALVQIDEPKFRFSIRQNLLPNITGAYYVRLHGRNAANWWRHASPDDRYDYLYSAQELRPFVETARAVRAIVRKAYLYFNNHFAAKAVVNATILKEALGQPVTGEYRDEMVARYPELRAVVARGAPPERLLF
jgi:uncharacterized protein YecE (DUF72 family)